MNTQADEYKEKLYFVYIIMVAAILGSFACALKELEILPGYYKEFTPEQYEATDYTKWKISADRFKIIDRWHTSEPTLFDRRQYDYYHILIDDAYVISVRLVKDKPFYENTAVYGEIYALSDKIASYEDDTIFNISEYVYEAFLDAETVNLPLRILKAFGFCLIGIFVAVLLYRVIGKQRKQAWDREDIDEV